MRDWRDRLQPHITALNAKVGVGLVHGDAHAGNLLRRGDGPVVLCDFDATCLGPWQVDLVAVAVGEVRFGRAGAQAKLTTADRYDVTTRACVAGAARGLRTEDDRRRRAPPRLSPGVAPEFTTGLRSIQHGDPAARWTPFADLST